MKTITIQYYGVHGEGRSVTEAKRDAGGKIERMITEGFTPLYVSHAKYPGLSAFIWRDGVSGWVYRIVDEREASFGRQPLYGNGAYESRDVAEEMARNHLAQNAMVVTDSSKTGLEFLKDSRQRASHLEYLNWQRAYRFYKAQGNDDVASHRLACEHQDKTEFIQDVDAKAA